MKQLLPAYSFLFLLLSCNDAVQQTNGTVQTDSIATAPVLDLDGTDSIEVLFYPDPNKQKEYKRLMVADTALINALRTNIVQDTVAHAECPHEVKMYWFRNGDVYKTVYAATADSCRYFAYAVNSRPQYVPMQDSVFALIRSLRPKAR